MGTKPLIVSYNKCGCLGDAGVKDKHAVCDYVVILVYFSCVGF
jgi:hypothetical protein